MKHEHTHHVAADADKVYAALADVRNLPHYVPQMTRAEPHDGDKVTVEARYAGHTQTGEGWFRTDDEKRRIEWGSEGSEYNGWLQVDPDDEGSRLTLYVATVHGDAPDPEVMGTLDAIRRLVEAWSKSDHEDMRRAGVTREDLDPAPHAQRAAQAAETLFDGFAARAGLVAVASRG